MNIRMLQAGVLAVASLLVSASAGSAQPQEGRRGGGQTVARQLAGMKERLKLTGDQEKKVKPILEEAGKKMMDLRNKSEPGQPPSDEVRAEMAKNREETTRKLSDVLSKEQMADYEKMMSERRGGFGRPGGKKGNRNQ